MGDTTDRPPDRAEPCTCEGMPRLGNSVRNELTKPGDSAGAISEARFAGLLETAMDGIIVYDEKTRILVFNKACETLFGYRFHEIVGLDLEALVPSSFVEFSRRRVAEDWPGASETGVTEREIMVQHKDGTLIPVEISVGEAPTCTGRQFIAIVRDVRPRKAAEERVNQLQAQLVHMARVNAVNEMGTAIAHELNQPLTAVVLYLQSVLRRFSGQEPTAFDNKTAELVGKAEREAKRAGSIIQRMRQFIQKREPEPRPVNIRSLLDDALELTVLGSHADNVKIERLDDGSACTAIVDAVQIQQIFVNLIRNAIDAARSKPDPAVRARVTCDANTVTVEIRDSGPGIRPEVMDTLFKAFSSDKTEGLGLGLAISRTIAQNHHGDLKAMPGGQGIGATFMLTLPASN